MDANTSQVITGVASTLGVVLVAWIAYKQAQLGKVVAKVAEQTDGLTSALVATTAKASKAEGKLEGKAEEKANPTQAAS